MKSKIENHKSKMPPAPLLLTATLAALVAGGCASYRAERADAAYTPPPVTRSQPYTAPAAVAPAAQQNYGPAENTSIVPPDQAQAIVDRFRARYSELGNPRLAIVVNRPVVSPARGGLRLSGRTEQVETTRTKTQSDFEPPPAGTAPQNQTNIAVGGGQAGTTGSAITPGVPLARGSGETTTERVNASNTYTSGTPAAPTLADRQTSREVERLLGRPLRAGGARLVDPALAASLLADQPLDHFTIPTDDAARRDREALLARADVVVEVLVSSRPITVTSLGGNRTYTAPDIEATAVRLSDSAILGQASARDILGRDRDAGRVLRNYDVRDITEAVALALMDDLAAATPAQ